ncbi:sulfotransferase domain-containing protein [uncultured Draconibacterium sp.]|uniref:sulfotransferase domain-containing protein n=1 Tax=uncultured Draconibacterium sp. TaxID=1573823 RepID=UPI003261227B
MKVDFIIIGAMKAGTTSLYELLKEHPQISFSKIKETHFFSQTSNWQKNIASYHKLFSEKEGGKLLGEASTSYAFRPHYKNVAEKIYNYNPDMKIIYIVRNPIDRSISHYMHSFSKGYTKLTIDEEIKSREHIIQVSRYFYQIEPYLKLFGKEQILFIDFEDFIKSKKEVLDKLAYFLNIDKKPFSTTHKLHANPTLGVIKLSPKFGRFINWFEPVIKLFPEHFRFLVKKMVVSKKRVFQEKPKMNVNTKQAIIEAIKPEIPELEKLMGKDLSKWIR